MRSSILLLSAIFVGCSGSSTTKDGTAGDDDDDDNGGDDDDDDTVAETAHTGGGGSGYIEPVAVGFELLATLEPDGTLTNFNFGDGYDYPPQVIITFADLAFFSATDDAGQEGHYCSANGFFSDQPVPVVLPLTKPDQIPTRSMNQLLGKSSADNDNAIVFWSYDVALLVDVYSHDCGGLVDPAVWGTNAENLVDPFNGAHFGIGLGVITEYLQDGWTKESVTEFGDAMLANYIAINDVNGNWYGFDWTTSILWQNDTATNEVLIDAKGTSYQGTVPVDTAPVGGSLPEGYLRSYAQWYQDFAPGPGSNGIDFANLRDGAP